MNEKLIKDFPCTYEKLNKYFENESFTKVIIGKSMDKNVIGIYKENDDYIIYENTFIKQKVLLKENNEEFAVNFFMEILDKKVSLKKNLETLQIFKLLCSDIKITEKIKLLFYNI